MDFETHGYFSAECTFAINHAASYKMHISNVYLALAYKFDDNGDLPPFALILDQEAEASRERAKLLLKYLRRREGMINLPVFKQPNLDEVSSPRQALELALKMESRGRKILLDLKSAASADGETDLLNLAAKFLFKQKRNEDQLECQISYQKIIEQQEQPENLTENPGTSSGENPGTSSGKIPATTSSSGEIPATTSSSGEIRGTSSGGNPASSGEII